MYDDHVFSDQLDYPEVLLKGRRIKRRFWEGLSPWSAGYLGESAPRPIPQGRVELPLRVDPDFAPAPEFDVWTSQARSLTDEEITEEMNRVEEEMKRISPQFFLRNIGRMEMEADEDMEMATQATEKGLIREEKLEQARATAVESCRYVKPEVGASDIFNGVVKEWRYLLYREEWSRVFSKEAKDRSKTPPWAYFPDREIYERYRGVGIREFIESEQEEDTEEPSIKD